MENRETEAGRQKIAAVRIGISCGDNSEREFDLSE